MSSISIEDFKKLEIKIGTILSAEPIAGADRLLKLIVDCNETNLPAGRQVVAGLAEVYKPEELVGKQVPILVNLEPRTFKGVESQGMLLAVNCDGKPVLLSPQKKVPEGVEIC